MSNEGSENINLFFDNLSVQQKHGPLLEETHYYPFGLAMNGISSKAAGKLENKYKFNGGTELNNDFDIGFYETNCRSYDPQLGRFLQEDELAESNWEWTPYNFASDNPMSRNDPLGLRDTVVNGEHASIDKDNANVTVKGIKKLNHNQMQAIYWRLRDVGNGFAGVNL